LAGTISNRFKGLPDQVAYFRASSENKASLYPIVPKAVESARKDHTEARGVIDELVKYCPSYKFSIDVILDRKLQIAACGQEIASTMQ